MKRALNNCLHFQGDHFNKRNFTFYNTEKIIKTNKTLFFIYSDLFRRNL